MRSSFVAASIAAALALVFACSDSDNGGGGTSSGTLPDGAPEGSVVTGDGAVVDPDGNVVVEDTAPPSKVNVTTESVTVLGNARTYVLAVPKTYAAAKKYPLVVALHGDGQNAAGFHPFLGFDLQSGDDAIIAYPDQSVDLFTPYDQNADQQLVEATINAVKGKYSIDDAKVWALGYSKGGYQLNQIACRKPGVFTAMAVHAGGAPQDRQAGNPNVVDCPAAVGLPVFVTHGALDDPGGGEFGAYYWSTKAGCQSTRSATTPTICEKYNGCAADKPVVFCVVPNQPHYPLYEKAAEHSWAFFKTL